MLSAWGFEMETLIIAWSVLVQTDSAMMVAIVGALRFVGTLTAPAAGVLGDRFPRRHLLLIMRCIFLLLALSVVIAAMVAEVTLAHLFAVAAVSGLLRPAEMMMRQSLVADTVPGAMLTNALGFTRTTMDSARIAGALAGAGALSVLGIGMSYVVVSGMYVLAVGMTIRIEAVRMRRSGDSAPWRDLIDGLAYVRQTPALFVIMFVAFAVNFTAFPMTGGLLPIVAREIYGFDEFGLARLISAWSAGALVGSLGMAVSKGRVKPATLMLTGITLWHLLIIVFAFQTSPILAYAVLVLIGVSSSCAMIAMSVVVMSIAPPEFRGRVMGVRMLAVYGLPLGLLGAGYLMEHLGVVPTVLLHASAGLVVIVFVSFNWRRWVPG